MRCKHHFKPGFALQNKLVGYPDFLGDRVGLTPTRGMTISRTGAARSVSVWKCTKCGHSITFAKNPL